MSGRAMLTPRLSKLGRVALVTGASDGIGRATAEALAREGFDLIVTARREPALQALAERLRRDTGVSVDVVPADLASAAGVDTLLSALSTRDVGVAVLAAGFGSAGAFAKGDIATEQTMLALNCGAVLTLTHALSARMIARGAGQIVLFGSIVGFQGNGGSAHYSATKAWVQTLAEGLAIELRPQGVHVLSVAPGPVATGFGARAGMKMGNAETPETIATGVVRALGRSGTIRPGRLSKLLGWSLATTPRFLRVKIMTGIITGMAAGAGAKGDAHAG